MARILVVDNDAQCRRLLTDAVQSAGHVVDQVTDGKKAVGAVCVHDYDLVILDFDLPKRGSTRAMRSIQEECPEVTVIAKTTGDAPDAVLGALHEGAYDFLPEPLHPEVVQLVIERALKHRRAIHQKAQLLSELQGRYNFDDFVGTNPAARRAREMATEMAATHSPVIICGESGTGREYVARAIHFQSKRAAGPFIRVGCTGSSEEELQIELFGREKGVSRDSAGSRAGAVELAGGGTLYLDDITSLGPDLQDKLLRVLQHGEFERVGGSQTYTSDVRIIASTSRNFDISASRRELIDELHDFLNVFSITIPPLRDMPEDIPALVHHFVSKFAKATGKSITGVSDAVMQQLIVCEWKGNIRELENCIERCVMHCDSSIIQPSHLNLNTNQLSTKRKQSQLKPLRDIERDHIKRVLVQCNWNKSAAAGVLQIDRKTLRCKIREFGFEQPDDKQP